MCSRCQGDRGQPPRVPAGFWRAERMRKALDSWHMGRVIAAYRVHPWHRQPLSQEVVAGWLDLTQTQLSRIENGSPVQDLVRLRRWAGRLGIPPELLWFKLPGHELVWSGATSVPDSLNALVGVADAVAEDSLRFTNRVAGVPLDRRRFEALRWDVGRLAVEYVHVPLITLFRDLVETRDALVALLSRHQRPADARELYQLCGVTSVMLAHASQNVGNQRAALAHLRTAWTCADMVDHDPLRAWSQGTAALIHEWSQHHDAAMTLAAEGRRWRSSKDSRVRLAAIEARAAARMGNEPRAQEALAHIRAVQDTPGGDDELVSFGGILTFPEVKLQYYLGGTYSLLGEHDRAEQHAAAAIAAYEAGSQAERSYGDEALARLDLVNSRLARQDLAGAADAIGPVLALPGDRRIRQLDVAVGRTRLLLARPEVAQARLGRELEERVRDFQNQLTASPALRSRR